MNSPRMLFSRVGRNRRGLSFLEFVGCILALGSGVAIGSVYLGVDMKTLFVGILEQAELVDPGFFGGKAIAQQPDSSGPSAEPPPTIAANAAQPVVDDTIATTARTEAESTAGDIPTAEDSPSADDQVGSPAEGEVSENAEIAATVNYWQGLAKVIVAEKKHRSAKSLDTDNWQLFDYLTIRREGHQKAVDDIQKLDERGVDKRLLWHGRQVLSWHQAGAKLYGRAVDLLTDAPSDQLMGPYAQSWQSSATQHRMEEKLVREKHLSVAGYLDHAYKEQGPFQPAF